MAYASDRNGAGNLDIWIRPYPSGDARRVTNEPFNDSAPDFSPDGSQIVYRSERDGGGIYLAQASGTGTPPFLPRVCGLVSRQMASGSLTTISPLVHLTIPRPDPAGFSLSLPKAGPQSASARILLIACFPFGLRTAAISYSRVMI